MKMYQKTGIKVTTNYSPNFNLNKRLKKKIKFIIIHYTGMKTESSAIKRLQDSKYKVSSHFYIKNNGSILVLVPELYEAWHAGVSNWKSYKLVNKYSIGIEITNPGHQYGYKNFSSKQIFALKKLLKYLMKKYRISKKCILGHSDVSPNRKKDPGEKFPWKKLAKNGLCLWHTLDIKKIKKLRKIKVTSKIEKNRFFLNLQKIGYNNVKGIKNNISNKYLTMAFQRRFRQSIIDGKIDKECLLISKNLLLN
tara:strand:+ start:739 stop:1491 length:753 start_codon:yes stop_codon:yes gene_type:complete